MPADEKILGFGNRWYKEALENAITHQIFDDLIIKSVTALYFLATKIEAFKTRGKNDFLDSHDFEDIITVIAGRINIADEVALANNELKIHLKHSFMELLNNDQFEVSLPGHVSDGPVTIQRVQTVIERIIKITEVTKA
jgi:predicted nucleotidyltransferase